MGWGETNFVPLLVPDKDFNYSYFVRGAKKSWHREEMISINGGLEYQ
jgi:hypothetical protein